MAEKDAHPGQFVEAPAPAMSALGAAQDSKGQFAQPDAPQIEGYRILEPLGRGGMGVVWRAVQLGTRREVALKVMNPSSVWSPAARRLFEREIELASRLDHPHIARVYDSGLDRRNYFYAMELVAGDPVDDHVRRRGLTRRQTVELMKAVCDAVQHAHRHGIIHRDLKPTNILITSDGQPRVLDFGLAKALTDQASPTDMTRTGQLAGTPAYMSPEQAAGDFKKVDSRSDVYALGVILYELLTGHHPHSLEGTDFESRRRVIEEEVRRPRRVCPTLDRDLESLLLKALAKRPKDRYQSAGELAQDLGRFQNGDPLLAGPATVTYFLKRRLRQHRVPVAVAAVILIGFVCLVAAGYVRERRLRQEAEHARADAVLQAQLARSEAEARRRTQYFNQIALAESAYQQGQINRAQDLLADCPPDLRRWEWHYLGSLTDESTITLEGHRQPVLAAVWVGSGRQVQSVDTTALIRWDPSTGRVVAKTPLDDPFTEIAALSRDGKTLWTVADRRLIQRDAQTGQTRTAITADCQVLALSPDGRYIAQAGYDGLLRLWDRSRSKFVVSTPVPYAAVRCLVFSPDGKTLAIGGGKKPGQGVTLMEVPSGAVVREIRLDESPYCLAYRGDGLRLAIGGVTGTLLWDRSTGQSVAVDRPSRCLAFGPQGRVLAAGGWDAQIRLLDAQTGLAARTLRGHRQIVTAVAFSPDGHQLLSASDDRTVKIWDVATESPAWTRSPGEFLAATVSGTIAAIQWGHAGVLLLDVVSNEPISTLPIDAQELEWIVMDPQGRWVVTAGFDGDVKRWDVTTGRVVDSFRQAIRLPTFSPDGRVWAYADSDQIVLKDPLTSTTIARFNHGLRFVSSLAFSGDGRQIAWAGDGSSVTTAVRMGPVDGDRKAVTLTGSVSVEGSCQLYFIPDPNAPRILSVDTDRTVQAWDRHTGRLGWSYRWDHRIESHAISPDGRALALGGYGRVLLIDPRTGAPRRTFAGHANVVTRIAFSHDGQRVASVEESGSIKLWDPDSGTAILTLPGQGAASGQLYFQPDGRQLYIIGHRGTLRRLGPRGGPSATLH